MRLIAKAKLSLSSLLLAAGIGFSAPSEATIVEFQTSMGSFQVNLYDETTPATVANFLAYVNAGSYENIIIHRSVPGFVVQGGGFAYNGALPLNDIDSNPAVANEPKLSNVRGTIAMAKLSGNANSATNEWFFNLADNSANLDVQNGGFTVFGEVIGDGMQVVEAIAALDRFNFGGALTNLPLRDYTTTDATNGVDPDADNFLIISNVIIIDPAANTAAGLNPPENTLLNNNNNSDDGGGGSLGFAGLALLLGLSTLRRRKA
ncbi:peptidylprolyl isomerase [Pleionea sp. CnH1-48]|uniref:peptidylprolyl isomerase n=1 Tax=Pleionea sp. CnH1-48 TaxID=2954494 RepID=UPI002097BECB|nr:peptidylprolyl isomerase [Pleionea sp. CnH1-48]MCO7223431.1 peptidylprolyl isomerase [Pleionea sp. CnH1-48]